jgi:hypothetical protein
MFRPGTGSLLLAREMTIGDAHLAPGQRWLRGSSEAAAPCYSTVTGLLDVDVYDVPSQRVSGKCAIL